MQLMKTLFSSLIFCYSVLFTFISFAQELPPVSQYSPSIYNADNQNWSVTQATSKDLFFANNNGLLKFDGERWQLFPSPNNTIMRSVFAVGEIVYSGAYMDFGVWSKSDLNEYSYQSLSSELQLIEDEQFWKIDKINQLIAFQSLNSIYLYNTISKTFEVISSEYGITKMMIVNNILYYHKLNEGIFKLVNGVELAVNTSEFIKNNIVVNLYVLNDNLHAQTQFNGIINLSDNIVYEPENLKDLWSRISVYNSLQVENGDIYLGTISHGLLKLSNNRVVYHLNQENTLSNNTVLNLFQDKDRNIWLALDNGINSINMSSHFSVYTDGNGELGTVYTSIHHQGTLYLGTNQGLFYKDNETEKFTLVENTKGQVWSLFEHEEQLFCGHNSGTFLISGHTAELIFNESGTWLFKPIDESTILSGNYNGLHKYKRLNSAWVYDQKIDGFNISTKYFEFTKPQEILVNHEYKGIYKLSLNDSYSEIIDVSKIESVPKGLYSSIIKFQDKVLYAYADGIFSYDTHQGEFKKDSILSSFYTQNEYTSGRLVQSKDGKIWGFTKSDIFQLLPSSLQDGYVYEKVPLSNDARKQISGYENVSLYKPDVFLFGSSNGYIKLNLNNYKLPESNIKFNDVVVSSKDGFLLDVDDVEQNEFPNRFNNLEFLFSSYTFESFYKSEYQYKLSNFNSEWSEWQSDNSVSFKNLPPGDYTFSLRSRVGSENISEPITYTFQIKKPFMISNLMIGVYIVLSLVLLFFINSMFKRYYKTQNLKIQEETAKEIEFKELENQRKIMRLKNEQLEQDIESKNRELAISTMSLIKKNEFLAALKSELKDVKANEGKNLDKVLRTINKNLNNSDDWSFFEEAFNNADKDFLKKIKSKHPSLTPNDLRLCAYLRLNLSSKEIAPLFNISTKSVEVKRYRLRKKMDLSRDEGLTDYILEL